MPRGGDRGPDRERGRRHQTMALENDRGEAQAGQRHAEAQAASPVREDDHRHPKPGDERSGGFDH